MKFLIFFITLLSASLSFANTVLKQSPDLETLKQMSIHNQEMAERQNLFSDFGLFRNDNVRPFAEYQETGYIFFNDDDFYGYAGDIKSSIAKTLPDGVTLVVYSTSTNQSYLKNLRNEYLQYIADDRLVVLQVPRSGSNNFWTRDNLPLPVWTDDQFTLVDARYYYNFEPDAFLVTLYGSLSTKHDYFFEGGNFMANSRGECIVVNRRRSYPGGTSDTAAIPDSVFRDHYGCKKLTRLRHIKGIGHADEVVKFMGDDIVVTDTPQYVETLEGLGYDVRLLPEPDRNYETYVNSLLVNNVLYVPEFGESGDSKAVDVYEKLNLGLTIITLPSRQLATGGQGGIHCITMNYPPVPMQQLLNSTGGSIVQD